jgi:glycosyltransferase involved in cell wall biosynthesis
MRINFLSNKIPWFGTYTGYEQLPNFIEAADNKVSLTHTRSNVVNRIIGKLYSKYRGWIHNSSYISAAILYFNCLRSFSSQSIDHVLYLENYLSLLDRYQKAPKNIVGTIHLPPDEWKPHMLDNLSRLSSALILYRRDLEFFENYVGPGRVKFIHYGVNTQFFRPASQDFSSEKRILFAGHYLRNTEMLHRVIDKLSHRHPDLGFDLLVPEHARTTEGFLKLRDHPSVTWHQNLSDEGLRNLYQRSYILLLPMNNSGANTALVESMACGLPIVTTDVGGIRDYGGGSLYPIVPNNDDGAMVNLVEKYLSDLNWRDKISQDVRNFAIQELDWPVVAQKHIDAYQSLQI